MIKSTKLITLTRMKIIKWHLVLLKESMICQKVSLLKKKWNLFQFSSLRFVTRRYQNCIAIGASPYSFWCHYQILYKGQQLDSCLAIKVQKMVKPTTNITASGIPSLISHQRIIHFWWVIMLLYFMHLWFCLRVDLVIYLIAKNCCVGLALHGVSPLIWPVTAQISIRFMFWDSLCPSLLRSLDRAAIHLWVIGFCLSIELLLMLFMH